MTYFDCIDRLLVSFFYRYGKLIARKPLPFLLVSLVAAIGLSIGVIYIQLETDTVDLFTPDKSQARDDGDIMYEKFPVHYNDYSPSRGKGITDQGANAIAIPKDGNNVLREDVISEILRFNHGVLNITVQNSSGIANNYLSLCAMSHGACLTQPVLQAYSYNASRVKDINLTHPFYHPSKTSAIFVAASLGDVAVDETSTILTAGLFSLNYYLKSIPELETMNREWEEEFLRYARDFESDVISMSFIVSHSLTKEITSLTITILPYLIVAIVLLSCFAVASCMVADWVLSKTSLAMLGLVSASLAIGASTGLLCFIGVPFNIVAASMPFLIIGIGIDDMFIMIAAWRKTNPRDSVEERMGHTYSEAAVSITITSITDALAFGIGAISPLPAVRVFCLYTGVAVIFDYLFQITFFGACMVYSGRREAANRHCITLVKVVPRQEAKSKFYKLFCAGGSSSKDPDSLKSSCETALMTFFRDHYGPVLMVPAVKVFALLLFLAYIGSAVYGLFQVTEGLEMKTLAGDGSTTHNFFDYQTKYFSDYGPPVSVAIHDRLDYSDPSVQETLERVVSDLESSEYIHSSNFTEFWLRDYFRFLDILRIPEDRRANEFMTILVEQFLKVPSFSRYAEDIIFRDGPNGTEIEESRFIILGDSLKTTSQQMKMMADVRERAEKADLNMTAFSPLFIIYEQFVVVLPLTLQNILIAVGCMFVIALLLIPHPFCAVMVTACIVSIQIGIIGYMSLWDVRLDGISMINIILCIGFSVDFSAHITYAFLSSNQALETIDHQHHHRKLSVAERKAVMALYSLGMPILQGALSTILANVVLVFSPSYIFRTFFKIMFMVMVLGMVHSLIFLPVLLSTFGGCFKMTSSTPASPPVCKMSKKADSVNQEEL
ncbi:patched domain-containing protein 3 isoform X3 [Strongylocentrotus purpuratus]|uniref:SSD domain-containing protein n=1 Tax=Strongylocentrotus purpuratus TaxID=7668 RepID=A0A7M7NP02_STRPU|nr:patched domain-containing protein 3 isoform X3 [Strongylocentrotus purpuratus]